MVTPSPQRSHRRSPAAGNDKLVAPSRLTDNDREGRIWIAFWIALAVALLAIAASVPLSTKHNSTTPHSINAVVTLSDNKTQFPLVSFGLQIYDDEEMAYNLTRMALSVGYRNFLVDTGHQDTFARACVDSHIPREELFVTAALPLRKSEEVGQDKEAKFPAGRDRRVEDVYTWTLSKCQETLASFSAIQYVDQLLLDAYPGSSCSYIQQQWRAMELMVGAGQVRTLAVTNFSPAKLDSCLFTALNDSSLKHKPVVNQLPYNVAYHPSNTVKDNMDRGLLVQAWSPLGGSLGSKFTDRMRFVCDGVGKRHNKSFAQVALRWIVQKGAAFVVRSSVRKHFEEDLDIFDFELSEGEMQLLGALAA